MRYGMLTALAAVMVAGLARAASVTDEKAAIDRLLDQSYPALDALYKDIHAHPELGFAETRTAARLAQEMRTLGFEVTEHVGGTGVVAVLRNGAGPTVMVRTELDALPMREETDLPYASQVQADWNGRQTYVAHSCGHDAHMAIWVGVAHALATMKSGWRGTLVFIGQPAEEGVGGSMEMLKDGLFTRFPRPDYGFALHTGPSAHGEVHYRPGVMDANVDDIVITFKGRGGHGAIPNATIDPVLIAARFVVDVQSVISREKDPLEPGVVTIGAIQGGSAGNIIPDQVIVRGTIRDFDAGVRAKLKAGVERVARAEAAMAGAPDPDIAIGGHSDDAVINDPALTARIALIFKAAFGDKAILDTRPISASEDYSAFINAGLKSSLYFQIGIYDPARVAAAANGGPPLPVNHSPRYAPVPEPTIRTGVEAMTLAVLGVLERQ